MVTTTIMTDLSKLIRRDAQAGVPTPSIRTDSHTEKRPRVDNDRTVKTVPKKSNPTDVYGNSRGNESYESSDDSPIEDDDDSNYDLCESNIIMDTMANNNEYTASEFIRACEILDVNDDYDIAAEFGQVWYKFPISELNALNAYVQSKTPERTILKRALSFSHPHVLCCDECVEKPPRNLPDHIVMYVESLMYNLDAIGDALAKCPKSRVVTALTGLFS